MIISLQKNTAFSIWFLLILLSSIAAYIGEFNQINNQLLIILLVILIIKAQLIIDYFMKLKHVNVFWRYSMSAFSVTISVIIWAIF